MVAVVLTSGSNADTGAVVGETGSIPLRFKIRLDCFVQSFWFFDFLLHGTQEEPRDECGKHEIQDTVTG